MGEEAFSGSRDIPGRPEVTHRIKVSTASDLVEQSGEVCHVTEHWEI